MTQKIRRSTEPEALECPFEELNLCTPNDLFYVRNHFPPPQIDLKSWTLEISGTVSNTLRLSFDDILALPSSSVDATLECAGNSRTFLVPPVEGVQWDLGGISNAKWTGVSLAEVMKQAGLKQETVEFIFEGGDIGEAPATPRPPQPIRFARSLPVKKAMDGKVLLAYEMNGERLSMAHGFPLRLIVPGWYAVASVKWLNRIVAVDHRFLGYWQTTDYSYWDTSCGEPENKPITEMLVKSEIARPRQKEKVPANAQYMVVGAAWSGAGKIVKVEVSTDGGASWAPAAITTDCEEGVWCLWQFAWETPGKTASAVLMSRATDEKGNQQPLEHNSNHMTYMINFCLPIPVVVE